jgi:hypothetical protein
MTVSIHVTKIEIVDPKITTISVIIDSPDLGRLSVDIAAETEDGDPTKALHQVRSKLQRFGRELAEVTTHQLRLSVPPHSN